MKTGAGSAYVRVCVRVHAGACMFTWNMCCERDGLMFYSCFGVVGYSWPYLACTDMHNLSLLKEKIYIIEELLMTANVS